MKRAFKYLFILAFVLGGWVLSAASLHVVRAPGRMVFNLIPVNIQLVPKSNLNFKETWVDTTKWSVADVEAHGAFKDRLQQAGKVDLLTQAMNTPVPPPPPVASAVAKPAVEGSSITIEPAKPSAAPTNASVAPTTPPAERKPTSIFDFSNEKKK